MNHTPKHVASFLGNLGDVRRLLDIHGKVVGTKPGYKANVEVLHKSAIVLLVACWEAYAEDLTQSAFEFLLNNAKDPSIFPASVLVDATQELKKNPDERTIWQLAGDGWRTVLRSHKQKCLKRYLYGFNTPKPENIDKLFKSVIGIPSISTHWHWYRMSAANVSQKLIRLVELRGSIAHRVAASSRVYKSTVIDYIDFVNYIAVITNNRICDHLKALTGKVPWSHYKFGAVG
jgi:hypothetical protein